MKIKSTLRSGGLASIPLKTERTGISYPTL